MSDTPRTDALLKGQESRSEIYFPLRLHETINLCRQLERELLRASVDAARWNIASEYMTAHNRSIVEGLIQDELPAPITVSVDYTSPTAPSDPYAAPQGQEVCQHARLPNDRVPEPAVAAPVLPDLSRRIDCEFCELPLTLWQAQVHDCLRLDHFDKEEWFDFARRLKPGLTDDEYEQMWERFCAAKAEHARHS